MYPAFAQGAAASHTARRRQTVLARQDIAPDSVYAVTTTGVYCRIGCPARTPKPEHVLFFDSGEKAVEAGFRPCKRCRPDEPGTDARDAALVADICRRIENSLTPPSLATLAASAGLSASHLRRIFRRITGVTPKAYAKTVQAERLRWRMSESGTVTEAIYEAGFGSAGHFYGQADGFLGMTPSAWRAGGAATRILYATRPCSLGFVLAAQTERGICAISLGDDAASLAAELAERFPAAELIADDPSFTAAMEAVVAFVDTPGSDLNLPLDIRGTAFQRRVWQALREIPAGATQSYADLAAGIGAPGAARAVARACAANTLAVAIPCHRVIRGNGRYSGYRWGVERKKALLDAEKKRCEE
ncbi:MAG: bifunctional DNA-binding transcriptional regulator/O6-methylguanine-DNA methyltransferase Ada [Deltaproteobacteria bacterium]|nr:bifunctional DNA-binding transcriptional regulator/O6-methylguanine-DNA methyltransferase Ada [Deltaproteobacteria bacterium]